MLRLVADRISGDAEIEVRGDFFDGFFIPCAFTGHKCRFAQGKVADFSIAVAFQRLVCSVFYRCVNEVEEIVVQHRMILEGCISGDKVAYQRLGINSGVRSCCIYKVLEDVLPYPPLFVGVGERCNSLGFQLGDGIIQLGSRFGNLGDACISKQLFVVHQHEQVAFDRKSKHLAVGGSHIRADRISHCGSQRLIGQVGTVFSKGINISAGGSLKNVRGAACGNFGFEYCIVVGLHNFQVDGHVRLNFFVFGDIRIESIGVLGRRGEHINRDRFG
ncbi:hypothetical protein D3C75_618080 [compost metagenome]